jgi:uncharacterized protein YciI
MRLFIFQGLDRAGALDLRKATRPAHLAWIETLNPRVKIGGPVLAEDGETPVGSVIAIEAETLAAAKAIFAEDPYTKAGLWGVSSVRPFNWLIRQ